MRVEDSPIHPGIKVIHHDSQFNLCNMFLRVQEFYESPLKGIKGNSFTLDEYMELYAKEYGNFDYFTYWMGFNIPGNVAIDWYEKVTGYWMLASHMPSPFRRSEEYLASLIKLLRKERSDEFYIIGVMDGCETSYDHEIAHALYYLNPEYREYMNNALSDLSNEDFYKLYSALAAMGYDDCVIKDEMQAYLATGYKDVEALEHINIRTYPFIKEFQKQMSKANSHENRALHSER